MSERKCPIAFKMNDIGVAECQLEQLEAKLAAVTKERDQLIADTRLKKIEEALIAKIHALDQLRRAEAVIDELEQLHKNWIQGAHADFIYEECQKQFAEYRKEK